MNSPSEDKPAAARNFIQNFIDEDNQQGRYEGRVQTRFPPEPNGHLHIGHAKSACLNFLLAEEYGGTCLLRFDDTNPVKEGEDFVQAIIRDIEWLGFDLKDRVRYASDYFDTLYEYAEKLIQKGSAYVCDLTPEQTKDYRGTVKAPGKDSPFRDRSPEENLSLFRKMKNGDFPDGSKTLRAKIDMASPNMYLRDPVLYRIMHAHHHRTGNDWCIYPMYDFAHGQSDSIEGVTHSICTLEFEIHRPLYEWLLKELEIYEPRQIEFARLNLTHTVMSKRIYTELIEDGVVAGWDDPQVPTIAGLRRRGYTPEAIRQFCEMIGVAKVNAQIEMSKLEYCIREDLNRRAQRVMAVLKPLKVTITNYPEGESEELEAVNNPEDPDAGTRKVPFSRTLYIERDDFMEDPPKKFFRLSPGKEVRLRYAFFLTCQEVVKNDAGEVVELLCTYDPETRGGNAPDGRKVKATLHWVSAEHAISASARLYNPLFQKENPSDLDEGQSLADIVNPEAVEKLGEIFVEPSVADAEVGARYQFERMGYFCVDSDSSAEAKVFNRIVTLKDSWAKAQKKGGK